MRHALGVERHRRGRAIEVGILRQLLGDDLAPLAEAHQHMLLHREIALDEIGHRRRRDAQQFLGRGVDQLLRRGDGRRVLAEEHGAVDDEVMVVAAVHRIDVEGALARQVLAVDHDGLLVVDDDVAIVAAQHVDMGRHVHEMARIGHEVAQPVAGAQRTLRERRHLHQMDVEVQQAGMIPARRDVAEGAFQHLDRLLRAGARRRLAGLEVPHLPRRLVHDRLGIDRAQVEIVRMGAEQLAHLDGEGLVPGRLVLDHLALRVARRQRADQRLLDRRGVGRGSQGALHGVVRGFERALLAGRIVAVPGQVVVRAGGVGDAPVRHGAAGIGLERLLETLDRFGMVEAVEPVQSAIEPELRLRRRGRDDALVGAEIVIVVHGPCPRCDPGAWCRRERAGGKPGRSPCREGLTGRAARRSLASATASGSRCRPSSPVARTAATAARRSAAAG